MTWDEVRDIISKIDVVLVPTGSMEQHGHHMPLQTDTSTSLSLSEMAAKEAEKRGINVLVAPAVPFGASWYHMDFHGSITLSQNTFITVVMEVLKSLRKHGFRNFVIVNSHGGNGPALNLLINLYYEELKEMVHVAQWWDLTSDILKEMNTGYIHAEEAETSLELYLGERVIMEKATKDAFARGEALAKAGKPTTRWARYDGLHKGASVAAPMNYLAEISSSGVVGDATLASREKGQIIAETMINRLVDICSDLKTSKSNPE